LPPTQVRPAMPPASLPYLCYPLLLLHVSPQCFSFSAQAAVVSANSLMTSATDGEDSSNSARIRAFCPAAFLVERHRNAREPAFTGMGGAKARKRKGAANLFCGCRRRPVHAVCHPAGGVAADRYGLAR